MKLSLKKVCIQQCKYASTQEMKIVEKFTTQLTTRSVKIQNYIFKIFLALFINARMQEKNRKNEDYFNFSEVFLEIKLG